MLVKQAVLERIKQGEVTLQFRRWRRPTVKAGGRLRTAVGELAIGAVDVVEPAEVTDADARRAGFASAAELLADLFSERRTTGRTRTAQPDESSVLYRIQVSYAGADARTIRRDTLPSSDDLASIVDRLAAIDRRSGHGPWTARTLELIERWPGRRAPELAELEGRDTPAFKAGVRKLKELGLTESLTVGYRLSARGEAVLAALRRGGCR